MKKGAAEEKEKMGRESGRRCGDKDESRGIIDK
jgi:hypothetical protein